MRDLWNSLSFLIRERIREKRWSKVVLALSIIVVFITTYALILPAITLSNSESSTVTQSQTISDFSQSFSDSETGASRETTKPKSQTSTYLSEDKADKNSGEQEAEIDNVIVKATYEEDTFSEKVTLKVSPAASTAAFDDKINQVLNEKKQNVTVAHSYDISFINEVGKEVEPTKEVSVSMSFKNTITDKGLHSEWKLYHFKENDVNQLEDLTEKTDTSINETQSGDVTGVTFKSDRFSTYTIAGISYEDFKPYISGGKFEGETVERTSGNTKTLTTDIRLNYEIPKMALNNSKSYAIELPSDTTWTSIQENQEYTGKDGNRDAFKYKFVQENGKKYIVLRFLDTYVASAGEHIKGDIKYRSIIGQTYRKENGSYTIPFTDKVTINIPSSEIKKQEEPHNEEHDIHSQKTGKVTYDGDTAYLDYTVTVWSDKGTKDSVKVKDSLTTTGLTIDAIQNVSIKKASFQYYGGNEDDQVNPETLSIQPQISGKSFDLTLPKLGAKQKYIVQYRYKVSGFPAGKSTSVGNSLDVETPDVPKQHNDKYLELYRNKIGKTGQYDEKANKIKWTITVNENQNDIADTELKDEMLAKANDVQITPSNGAIKTSKGYKFIATSDGKNINKYIITYTTDAGDKPNSWASQAKSITNTATITDKGETSSTTTTVPGGKGNTGGLNKIFEKMTPTDKTDVKDLTWKSTIKMPGDGKLPKGTEFEDVLKGQDGNNNGEHYFTKTQLMAVYEKLTTIFGNNNFEFSALESGKWDGYTEYKQIDNRKHYWRFKFKLLKEHTGTNDITLKYNSTINKSTIVYFTNTISSSGFSSEASYKYEESGKVFKMDGNHYSWDGKNYEYDSKPTEHDLQKDGQINWVVKVKLNDDTTSITITDTPPADLKLIGFRYGEATSRLNSGDFSVTDTEIKWPNPYWAGQYGANIDVHGTISSNGKITVTFTSKNGKTLKEVLNNTGNLYAMFFFQSNNVDPLDNDIKKTYTNKVSATINGQPSGEAEHTQNITFKPGQKISKSGEWKNDNRQVDYNVTLNPEGKDLAAGQSTYTVTDILSYQEDLVTKLSYDLNQESVKLYDSSGTKEIDKNLWSWTVTKTKDVTGQYKSVLKLTVPNKQKLILKYSYDVSREVNENYSDTLNVKNTAEINGLKSGKTETTTTVNWQKMSTSGTAQTTKFFKITKVDIKNYAIILAGATFEVREYGTNKVVATYKTRADGTLNVTQKGTEVVSSLGPLEENKLYYIIETQAPAGYELPEESKRTKYYFYFSQLDTLPSNIRALTNADVVNLTKQSKSEYVPNTPLPKTTSIKVDKRWLTAEGTQTDRVDSSITVKLIQIATKENASQGEKPEEVLLRTQTITKVNNWTYTFDDLPVTGVNNQGQKVTYTYKVVEEKVEGYDTSYSTTLPATSGTITITNKKQKSYELPKTGGSGIEYFIRVGIFISVLSSLCIIYKSYKKYQKGG